MGAPTVRGSLCLEPSDRSDLSKTTSRRINGRTHHWTWFHSAVMSIHHEDDFNDVSNADVTLLKKYTAVLHATSEVGYEEI